jgi:hypothetical protein
MRILTSDVELKFIGNFYKFQRDRTIGSESSPFNSKREVELHCVETRPKGKHSGDENIN